MRTLQFVKDTIARKALLTFMCAWKPMQLFATFVASNLALRAAGIANNEQKKTDGDANRCSEREKETERERQHKDETPRAAEAALL